AVEGLALSHRRVACGRAPPAPVAAPILPLPPAGIRIRPKRLPPLQMCAPPQRETVPDRHPARPVRFWPGLPAPESGGGAVGGRGAGRQGDLVTSSFADASG